MTRPAHSSLLDTPIDKLLNLAQERVNARNRTELCLIIGVQPPIISKIRHGKISISAETILRFHDATGLTVDKIREMLGVKIYFDLDAHTAAQQSGAQQTAQNEGSN